MKFYLTLLKKYASSKVHLTQPTGGMFAWMTMPEDVDCDVFFETCMDAMLGLLNVVPLQQMEQEQVMHFV